MGNASTTTPNSLGAGSGADRWGDSLVSVRDVRLSSSYATGGDSISPQQVGLSRIDLMLPCGVPAAVTELPVLALVPGSSPKIQALKARGNSIVNYAQGDIKGSVTVDMPIAGGTLPTNGQLLSTLAAANNTTAFTIALQPDIARNIGIGLKNLVAGASTGNAVSFAIVGLFRGAAQTETISFTALELTSTAQNEVAFKYGSKPFDSITSITPSAAQPASWSHAAGPGSKLGLPSNPANNLESDIIHLFKNAADLAKTGLYSTTNKTVNFGTLADGDDIAIEYNSGSVYGALIEVDSATDLSAAGIAQRMLFIGA